MEDPREASSPEGLRSSGPVGARHPHNGKDLLHETVGRAVGGFLGLLGRPRIERVFAQEVARRIPLPVDAKLSAAARGLQIAGIYICAWETGT